MKRHAVINTNNEVVNVIIWDGITPYSYSRPNHILKQFDECDIGDRFDAETNTIIRADRQYREPEQP
jgi:hypothetical protein